MSVCYYPYFWSTPTPSPPPTDGSTAETNRPVYYSAAATHIIIQTLFVTCLFIYLNLMMLLHSGVMWGGRRPALFLI